MNYIHQPLSRIQKQKRISLVIVAAYSLVVVLFCALCVRYITNVFNDAFTTPSGTTLSPLPRLEKQKLESLERILYSTPSITTTSTTSATPTTTAQE